MEIDHIMRFTYSRRMHPQEALWILENKARDYVAEINKLSYTDEDLFKAYSEVKRCIENLCSDFKLQPHNIIIHLPQGPMASKAVTQEPAPDTQAPEQKAPEVSKKDPVKVILDWLRTKQLIKRELAEEKPPVFLNGGVWEPPKRHEWRITKSAAYIYRELVSAAKTNEIPIAESEVPGFMINYLRRKNGEEITKNAVDKAAKRR
jgi:hypothetical protein